MAQDIQTTEVTDINTVVFNPTAMTQLSEIADLMSSSNITIPVHLRKSKADCFAIALQASQWHMNPFAVAQKTHLTPNGALGYEAQLISAVITANAPVTGAPEYEYIGSWDKILGKVEERKSDKPNGGKYYVATYTKEDEKGLGVICRMTLKGESKPREITVMMSQCYPRFSTQWATDPKMQISYVAIRKWARMFAPGVILGVYSEDEVSSTPIEKEINPLPDKNNVENKQSLDDVINNRHPQVVDAETIVPTMEQFMIALNAIKDVETRDYAKSLVVQMSGDNRKQADALYREKVKQIRENVSRNEKQKKSGDTIIDEINAAKTIADLYAIETALDGPDEWETYHGKIEEARAKLGG